MCEISADKLIKAVKARPSLYNKADARYHAHNKYKGKIWKEVCRDVYPNWDQLQPSQKVEYDLELQKRWKSLRTCFTRELALQKKDQMKKDDPDDDYGPHKKRKKYEYFDAMSFLLYPENIDLEADTEERTKETNEDSDEDSSDPLDHEIKIENFLYPEPTKTSRNIPQIIPIERNEEQFHSYYEKQQESRVVEEKLLDLLKEKKLEDEDEDRQFMLSLIPGFKKLNDRQKFEAKIEILKVLKNITFQDDKQDNNNI
ncbi:unnamed protein product [Diatraea saccharalis]|uniref:BESS domain-containing protein n=1 Tax=Diatraea saccharalis TaxID=40085 RepID=A0A9N9WDU2_9NEOP|nr:unnamed protein product [Diatraea saccharalis]